MQTASLRTMPRLQALLARMDPAHHEVVLRNRSGGGTTLVSSGMFRYEMALAALFKAHDRMRRSDRNLKRSRNRLARSRCCLYSSKGLTQSPLPVPRQL